MITIPCYLRTLRKDWRLSQEELAGLIGRGGRERVADVERALQPPNAAEILAYSLLFGWPPGAIFSAFYEVVEAALIEHAYVLDEKLREDSSSRAKRVRSLLHDALARATGKAPNPVRP